MNRLLLPIVAPVVALLAACGSEPKPVVDPQVRQQLIAGVEAVKAAATRHDRPAAEAALADLTRSIAAAQAQGRMDPANAGTVLEAADRVADDVRTMDLPAPPPPVTVTVPTPAPQENMDEEQQEQEEDKHKELQDWREELQKRIEEQRKQRLEEREKAGQ
ncbi:hypothetical protein A8924_2491 [Saccharopolyspora erythraea NRRL 2338]|uniref:Lipoprotein n=1 Tax=Saccharopolyspora erythraea TaxID=1836 RepID=A0ABN1CMG5_SACER|nr:hypothetical protein [Saccharopolyspora erythraea]EQD84758.1 hypothetical protein N599_18510 [Saccharopolyspora erythraea D]PFG95180.1 hypothetical protein A8924_2491 [Saccharopolyspora erythraea NRRL 2338]QRK91844.1 hypothetical protein JQX30_11005 [Saccharopolyspora erythraea]